MPIYWQNDPTILNAPFGRPRRCHHRCACGNAFICADADRCAIGDHWECDACCLDAADRYLDTLLPQPERAK